jgi:hypothetical protein
MTRRPESTRMVHGWHTAVGSVASGYAEQVGNQAAEKCGRVVDEGVAEADVSVAECLKMRRGWATCPVRKLAPRAVICCIVYRRFERGGWRVDVDLDIIL